MSARRVYNTCVLLALMLCKGIAAAEKLKHNDNLESLYPAYKLIKDGIDRDPELIYKLKHTFNPPANYRYWQVDGVEVILIDVSLSFHVDVQNSTRNMTGHGQQNSSTVHWSFQWTNSLLLNLIPGDVLLAMDPVIAALLYSGIVQSHYNRLVLLNLHLNTSDSALPACNCTFDELKQAIALYLSIVSYYSILQLKIFCQIRFYQLSPCSYLCIYSINTRWNKFMVNCHCSKSHNH